MLDAIGHVNELAKNNEEEVQVLVTGSFHLVGGILSLLDPKCSTI
jgi:folylpolyglutamate synthase/dihydropteroate synthase